MAIIKRLFENAGHILKGKTSFAPQSSQEIGLSQLNMSGMQSSEDREAIYPQWFFSSTLGQPRGVDIQKLREFSQSAWVQMVTNTFKRQIYTIPYDVIPAEEDGMDHKKDIKTVIDFYKRVNKNRQTMSDITSETITDIAEIDAGCWNLIYSNDSYIIGDIPMYDAWGRIINTELGLKLKPLGQRKLVGIKAIDGGSMLKQVDIHKNILAYWQYSFKHPRQNPTRFEPDEIVYIMMNDKSYSVYGFSAVQSIQQVLELLIQGTRYNKDLYTNNAIPDVLASLPKLPKEQLEALKRGWNNQYKGKPHQIGFINWPIESFHKLVETNRDLEWLDGQQWYFKIVFGIFGVSATEAGFFENSNKSNDDGQERVTVRNALEPYLAKFENVQTSRIITEILQREDHGLLFDYQPRNHTFEKIEFDQDMAELDHGTMTINEFRKKKGREPTEFGDEPLRRPMGPDGYSNFAGDKPNPKKPKDDEDPADKKKTSNSELTKTSDVVDAGNDIIEEAENYSDFLLKTFDKFESKCLTAADKIQIEKGVEINKTFGEFLKDMFNAVNTTAFAKAVKRFLKQDLITGMESAEAELKVDIGFTEAYDDKLNKLHAQQITGYTINGKKWHGIKGVTKEIQADIIQTVQDGISKNKSVSQIKEDIKESFSKFSDWRSEMIARTETNRIINEGKIVGYKESGLKGKKVWIAAIDHRTSEICRHLNGQERHLDEDFIDPKDRSAFHSPPAHPNCRSTIAFIPN
jgi:SPP1 gp7 family putative phage head morphogenesis protein